MQVPQGQQAGQAATTAQPHRWPLVPQPANRDESTVKDSKLINGYVERGAQEGEFWVFKRPGLLAYGSALSGNGLGVYNWQGDLYSIFDSVLYKNGVAVGTGLDTTGGMYKFSSCLGATRRLQLGNGVANYNYDGGAGLVAMAGANFPSPAVKGIGYLDGTTYIMDSNASIRGCDALNDPTAWTDVLNRLTAQIEPDDGVALAKQLVYILAIGQWSTEVFYDAANPTASPLSPVQGAKINYGCVNSDSVRDIDGVLFWIATNRSAAPQVIMLENLKPTFVSTKAIERLLAGMSFTNVISFSLKYEGHRFYGFTVKSSNITLVYDMADKMWAQWTDKNGNYWPYVASTFTDSLGQIVQHETNGKLYVFDAQYFTDDGDLITVDLYTPNFDGGTRRRKTLSMMEFVGDQTVGSVLQVRSNDADYEATKWTNFRLVDLGKKKPFLANCGSFMRRALHLRHQCNTRMRLQAIDLQMDVGTL